MLELPTHPLLAPLSAYRRFLDYCKHPDYTQLQEGEDRLFLCLSNHLFPLTQQYQRPLCPSAKWSGDRRRLRVAKVGGPPTLGNQALAPVQPFNVLPLHHLGVKVQYCRQHPPRPVLYIDTIAKRGLHYAHASKQRQRQLWQETVTAAKKVSATLLYQVLCQLSDKIAEISLASTRQPPSRCIPIHVALTAAMNSETSCSIAFHRTKPKIGTVRRHEGKKARR
jgi:hypothetical protein